MPVIHEHKNLGAHYDTTNRCTDTTSNKRANSTSKECTASAGMPIGPALPFIISQGKELPKAFYACSTTNLSLATVNYFTTALCAFLMNKHPTQDGNARSTTLVLYTCSPTPYTTVDPRFHILYRRVMDLRRAYWINKSFQNTIEKLMRYYCTTKTRGTFANDDPLFLPMPIGWKESHDQWILIIKPRKPIAILIQTLLEHNSWIDHIFTIWSPYAPDFNVLQSALHIIKHICYMICESSAFDALGALRKDFICQRSVDRIVSLQTINKAPPTNIDPKDLEKDFEGDQLMSRITTNNENPLDLIAANIDPTTYTRPEGKRAQHPHCGFFRSMHTDNLWCPYKALKASQIESAVCPPCSFHTCDANQIVNFRDKLTTQRHKGCPPHPRPKRLSVMPPNTWMGTRNGSRRHRTLLGLHYCSPEDHRKTKVRHFLHQNTSEHEKRWRTSPHVLPTLSSTTPSSTTTDTNSTT